MDEPAKYGGFRAIRKIALQKGNQMTKSRWSTMAAMFLAAAAAACSDGASRFSPIGPTPAGAATTSVEAAADWAATRGWTTTMADGRVAVADGVQVEGVDVIAAVSGACPARTVTIRGVAVAVTARTLFSAPLTCDSLESGRAVKVTGLLLPSGAGFAVTAIHLAPVAMPALDRPAAGRGEKAGGEGTIGAVTGSCPALAFAIGGHRVETTDATAYINGDCRSLREGAQVRLEVETHTDGTIVAERIEILGVPGRRQ